jgi:two-component system, chemotaxis family, chemotaxis protein CheY
MRDIPKETSFLLLEDVDAFRKLMIKDLRKIGVEGQIHEADCVAVALELCESQQFDFIISDLKLPDGTGYDFLLKVKQNDQLKNLPFVVFTTIDDIEHMLKSIEAGANEFIVKPWLFEELVEKLNFAWNKQQGKIV